MGTPTLLHDELTLARLASRAEGEGEEGKKEFSTPAWPLSPSDVY